MGKSLDIPFFSWRNLLAIPEKETHLLKTPLVLRENEFISSEKKEEKHRNSPLIATWRQLRHQNDRDPRQVGDDRRHRDQDSAEGLGA